MKIQLALLCLVFAGSPIVAQETTFSLWPEGKTPYAQPQDEESGRPMVFVYPAKEELQSGAAVVVCPGGGYGGLALDHEGHQIGQFYQEMGVTAFVLHYRLGSKGHHFPTQLADVQRAIRQARSQAKEYKIDPNRIGVMGFSAGGHLASMAATKFNEKAYEPSDELDKLSARPDFAVLCYAVISMSTEFGHGGSRQNLLGKDAALDSDEAKHVSSELNVTPETPPTFLFQTGDDTAVPAENSVLFYLALRKNKVSAEMHIYKPGPHGVGLFQGDPVLSTWSGHLTDWMRDSGFLASNVQRTSISGNVTLDGEPVSWGSVTFHPESPNLPITTLRIRNGRFKGETVVTKGALSFAGSIWEKTRDSKDRVITTNSVSPKSKEPILFDVKPEGKTPALNFDLKSR